MKDEEALGCESDAEFGLVVVVSYRPIQLAPGLLLVQGAMVLSSKRRSASVKDLRWLLVDVKQKQ